MAASISARGLGPSPSTAAGARRGIAGWPASWPGDRDPCPTWRDPSPAWNVRRRSRPEASQLEKMTSTSPARPVATVPCSARRSDAHHGHPAWPARARGGGIHPGWSSCSRSATFRIIGAAGRSTVHSSRYAACGWWSPPSAPAPPMPRWHFVDVARIRDG